MAASRITDAIVQSMFERWASRHASPDGRKWSITCRTAKGHKMPYHIFLGDEDLTFWLVGADTSKGFSTKELYRVLYFAVKSSQLRAGTFPGEVDDGDMNYVAPR